MNDPHSNKPVSWGPKLVALAIIIAGISFLVLTPGCTVDVAGQRVPAEVLTPDPGQFEVPNDIVAMHYYGVGGWGIQWRGQYLLTAPYFSNHGFLGMLQKRGPDLAALRAGVLNTPFDQAGMILVGHGHVDHAADIPGYAAVGLSANQAGVIANQTTLNMLASLMPPNEQFRCAEAPTSNATPVSNCTLSGFRITPLKSQHAANVRILGKGFTVAKGTVDAAQERIPQKPGDYLMGETWAYLIDLLDAKGTVTFRIHYMDAAAGANESTIPPALLAERPVDVHIACVPGFEYVDSYPEWAIERGDAGYVMMGHWEDFFRPRDRRLKPVTYVLNQKSLNEFAERVDRSVRVGGRRLRPVNKTADDCPVGAQMCGPRGEAWALPVPGETFHFRP